MLIFDVEATSLSRDSEVLQFAAVKLIKRDGLIHYVGYVNLYFWRDGWVVTPGITQITGLTKEFLETHKDKFQENLIILRSLIHSEDLLIGKNIKSFDMPLLINFINRHTGVPYGEVSGMDTMESPIKYVDLQQSYGKTFKETLCGIDPRFPLSDKGAKRLGTLTEWAQALNIGLDQNHPLYPVLKGKTFHNALYDVYITMEVFIHVFAPIYKRELENYKKHIALEQAKLTALKKKDGI